jgi:SAM-dependent methyltransferase
MKSYNSFFDYIFILFFTLQHKSICRIYQIINFNKFIFKGSVIEFGVSKLNNSFFKKNFYNQLYISDQINSREKKYIKINLQNNNNIKKKFSNVVIFNVLEHVIEFDKAIYEIKKILDKKGKIFLSTPFLYRYHGAPDDYSRYTSEYLKKKMLKSGFKVLNCSSFGTGPFMASYSMLFDYLKFIPLLPFFIIFLFMICDFFLSLFQKTTMSKIYPICIILEAQRKD